MGIPGYKRIATCILAGIVSSFCFRRIGYRFLKDWLSFQAVIGIAAVMLLAALVYAFYWGLQRNQPAERSSAVLAFWQGIIRYGIALDLSMIGFQKIFRLQFVTHLGALDLPFNSFTPEDLTFAFFGQSYALVCIIGSFQILGSLLLLFSRTRLAGVFLLLPVMLNIVLLNACYSFDWGESLQALELLIALLYLLFCEYHRLVEFFFRTSSRMPSISIKSPLFKNGLRLSILFIPLLLIWHYGPPDKNPWLTGKYTVRHLRMNQQDTTIHSCTDSLLSTVYLDEGNDCVFEYNNQQRRVYGTYQLNKTNTGITVVWRYPKEIRDTLIARLRAGDLSVTPHTLLISGKMGKDSLQIELEKQ